MLNASSEKPIHYWIQRADFRSEDHTASGASEIQTAFRSRSWPGELRFEESRQSVGEENCPPGLGIVSEDGRLLHLCPSSADLVVHYHYNHERRIFGIFPASRKRVVTADVPLNAADELIARFVADDHQGVLRILDQSR